ncbi:MAG: cysteine--tRNA ligase [Candidatus Obscuribacterales bacterium]|nr:cysteine--tRNA ligase [Candidatus Obscuribacterales bacterium]
MTTIQVYNTLSGKKEPFEPLNGNNVLMYACGPTVYDLSHLGHARMALVWDVVQRYLRFSGYDVTYVRNVTDVDDKIIHRAKVMGVTPEQLAREYTYTFWHDMHCLNVQPPDYEPKATEFIELMIEFTKGLIDKGHAYVSENDVYFDVASFKDYGKLGKKNLDDLLVGAREQVRSQNDLSERKKNPVDFALWKGARDGELGWSSPWGSGRPGWHLECSTMTKHVLGETIDIHAGGEDLVFPHHENEIAQSEALHNAPMAKYWLHNSFVQVNSEKMSKSVGNFSTIQDLLAMFSPDTIRLFALQTHYRHPIDFSIESLSATRTAMARLLRAASYANPGTEDNGSKSKANVQTFGEQLLKQNKEQISRATADKHDPVKDETTTQFRQAFLEAMDNDFNTAIATSQLFQLADRIFQEEDKLKQSGYAQVFTQHARMLGLTLVDTRRHVDIAVSEQVLDLVLQLRQNARANKDYQTSDLIRKQLTELGINVMDITGGGTTWERA